MTPKCKPFPAAARYKRIVIRSIRHEHQTLVIDVQGEGFSFARVSFDCPIGFRVLDERDLCEFWTDYHSRNGWFWEVEEGGWLDLESKRTTFNTPAVIPTIREYFLVCDLCINVLCPNPPKIEDLGAEPPNDEPTQNSRIA